MTGRLILAKDTLSSMPSYMMQYIKIQAKITNNMEKVQRDFIWRITTEKRKIHLLN